MIYLHYKISVLSIHVKTSRSLIVIQAVKPVRE